MSPTQDDPQLPVDLHYPDSEPVRLDVAAIVARGMRMRRRRSATRATAALVAIALVPGVVTLARQQLAPSAGLAGSGSAGSAGSAQAGPVRGGAAPGSGNGAHGAGGIQDGPALGIFGLNQSAAHLRVRVSVTLPARYDPITALAGDQSGAGIWFWDSTSSQVRVFHLSGSGALMSWPVRGMPSAVSAGFAVTRAGVAWLAIGSALARVDTRTGAERTWQIPAPRDNPAADRPLPSGTSHDYQVQALAVSADGPVAVADLNASSVQVLDPATGRFRQVMMPSPDDVPQAVGFAGDGALGVGFQHAGRPHVSGVIIDPASGPELTRTVTESFGVIPYGASSLLVGVSTPEVVSVTGQVRPLVTPVDQIDTSGNVVPPAPLPGGRLATILGAGILAFPADARSAGQALARSVLYATPVVACGPDLSSPGGPLAPSQPPASKPGRRPAGPCHLGVQQLATDALGDLWIVDGSGGRTVDWLVGR